jgi:peptidoglycan LD-endopeptidase LytH
LTSSVIFQGPLLCRTARIELAPEAVGEPGAGRRHLRCVKKFVWLACAALLVLALRPYAQLISLPFKAAMLYAREPARELAVPVGGVSVRQIGDSWHAPRSDGRRHEGQDIFAKRGTPVYAAVEGYVVRAGVNRLGGNAVWVLGAGGRTYYYAHLDAYAPGLSVGDHVTTETVLGYVGTTGNAAGTSPHLHFGVYAPGGALNPLPLLTDRASTTREAGRCCD